MTDDRIAYCPHCGNRTPHVTKLTHEFYERALFDADGSPIANSGLRSIYEARICSTCNDLTLYYSNEMEQDEQAVYPHDQMLDWSVPDAVRRCYEEACRVRLVSQSAYAVLLRRALETMCDDRDIRSGRLVERLKELSERNEIPPVLAEASSLLRTIGNAGAHANADEITVQMTWGMQKLFRAIVEYVYVAPSRIEQVEKLKNAGNDVPVA